MLEAIAQFTRALDQIAILPTTPALRREEIKLQVALITPLIHVKGYAARETKAAAERARLLIEQAEALGEPVEDPLLLFSVLYSFWVVNYVAFNGDVLRELATQFLALAEKQGTTVPLMIGHRLMATSLLFTGGVAEGLARYDKAIELYNPLEHRPLGMRFGQDVRVTALCHRSWALWFLGYPDAALADSDQALSDAREIGQAATLMHALNFASGTHVSGNYAMAQMQINELVALTDEKGALMWKAWGMMNEGSVLALTGRASDAIEMLISGFAAHRITGSTLMLPLYLPRLARARAELGQFEEAWHCIGEAMTAVETTKESAWAASVGRLARPPRG